MLTWGWKDVPEMVALWIDILLEANSYAGEWHGELFEEGTFPTSVEKLSINTGLSVRSVRTCLERLKKSGEISIETTSKGTKIIVNKWADFQCSTVDSDKPNDKQTTNDRQTNDKQSTTLKERKESKEYIKEKEIYKEKESRFIKPTLEEVAAYCESRHNNVNPEQWYDFYSSKGWKVGKDPMKDWKACIRTWERNSFGHTNVSLKDPSANADTLPTYDASINKQLDLSEQDEILKLMGKC